MGRNHCRPAGKKGLKVVNVGTSSHSPSTSLCRLKSLDQQGFTFRRGARLFYLLDLSDINDEANRWKPAPGEKCGLKALEYDVSADKTDGKGRRVKSLKANIIESFPMLYGAYNAIRSTAAGKEKSTRVLLAYHTSLTPQMVRYMLSLETQIG